MYLIEKKIEKDTHARAYSNGNPGSYSGKAHED
jgi:hypothetical protein